MIPREALLQAAAEGRLEDEGGTRRFYLNCVPVDCATHELINDLFDDHILTFDRADIESQAEVIPIRVRPESEWWNQ